MRVLPELQGAFCFVMADERSVFAARDPFGLRPLSIGKLPGGFVVASETSALDIVGASLVREVEPGELIRLDDRGLHSARFAQSPRAALCVFEFVYLSRADSRMRGVTVHEARREMGRLLAAERLTALYVTHDLDEAFAIADRVVLLREGRVAQVGTPDELRTRPADAWVAEFLGSEEPPER